MVNGHRMRMSCDDERTADEVRRSIGATVDDGSSPLGFILRSPAGRNRLYVLTDRCGFVMARSRRIGAIVASSRGLVSSFEPPAQGAQRFRMRAVYDGESATLFVPPLLFTDTPIERHLVRSGLSLIDRLVVDIDSGGRVVPPGGGTHAADFPSAVAAASAGGHVDPSGVGLLPIRRTFVPGPGDDLRTASTAELTATIAACAIGGTRRDALAVAARLAAIADPYSPTEPLRPLWRNLADERGRSES